MKTVNEITLNVNNKLHFFFAFELTNTKPFSFSDGDEYVSGRCIKRKIRDYVDENGKELFIERGANLDDKTSAAQEKARRDHKSFSGDMLKMYWDNRMFGYVNGNMNAKGAIQIPDAVTALRGKSDHHIFTATGVYLPSQGKKNGITKKDLQMLFDAMMDMTENNRGIRPLKLIVFEHSSLLGDCYYTEITDNIKFKLKDGIKEAKSLADYEFINNTADVLSDNVTAVELI